MFLVITESFVFSRTRVQYQLVNDERLPRTGVRWSAFTWLPASSETTSTAWTKSLGTSDLEGARHSVWTGILLDFRLRGLVLLIFA